MVETSEYKDFSLRGRASTITLQHLRYVVAAAEYGSLRQAREALLVEQSTLSRRIRQLEESMFLVSEGACLGADTHGNLLVGYFIKASTVHSTEILGDLGFDFVALDEEHTPLRSSSVRDCDERSGAPTTRRIGASEYPSREQMICGG